MDFSILTYNTLFNNGYENIKKIVDLYHPDVLCFQEVETKDANLARMAKYGYKLADYSNSFIRLGEIYGVATFYNEKSLKFIHSAQVKRKNSLVGLFYSFLSLILGYGQQKTFLEVDFLHKKTNKKLTICNIHLFVIGSNALRINHINHMLKTLGIDSRRNFIMVGDFNYLPYQRKKLEKIAKKYGLKEATKDVIQTIKFSDNGLFESFGAFQKLSIRLVNVLIKNLKIDYIFYKGLKLKSTERINVNFSDHYPIISKFSL